MPPVDPVADFLSLLSDVHQESENQWQARCPAHDDRRASLSVSRGDDGRVLLTCHAGCSYAAIAHSVGKTVSELFPKPRCRKSPSGKIVKEYSYRNAAGEIAFQVCRMEPKDFRQRRPDGTSGWIWDMKGVTRVLYRLPELLAAPVDAPVFIVEGEKDADALAALGIVATTNPGGAKAKWEPQYNAALAGRHVVILPDNDAPGRDHAQKVAACLTAVAASVRILELPALPPKGDVSDWLAAGGTAAQLLSLAVAAPEFTSTPAAADNFQTIRIDSGNVPVSVTLNVITDAMLGHSFYRRAGHPVMVHDDQIILIDEAKVLAGMLNPFVEFVVVHGRGDNTHDDFEPLPTRYATTWFYNPLEILRLPEIKLFTRNPVFTDADALVQPGYNRTSGIYFAGQEIAPASGTEALDTLLSEFCFRRPADRSNYFGMLLTVVLLPRFIGCKPGALFNGNQPELGKTILAQIIAILRDGHPVETCSYSPNDEEFEKRLASRVKSGATTIIIDNAKGMSRGRPVTIESGCLERSITDATLSFRLLGYNADIRAENSHIFCITANTPQVSRDLVTRCVPINLFFEGEPSKRKFKMIDPEGFAQEHRQQLLAELLGMVERWKAAGKPLANVNTRFNKRGWGNIVGGILETNGEIDFLENLDDAAHELDPVHRDVGEMVAIMSGGPATRWSSTELVNLATGNKLLQDDLDGRSPKSQSTRMGIILSRFVGTAFDLDDKIAATLKREENRDGTRFFVRLSMRGTAPEAQEVQNALL